MKFPHCDKVPASQVSNPHPHSDHSHMLHTQWLNTPQDIAHWHPNQDHKPSKEGAKNGKGNEG